MNNWFKVKETLKSKQKSILLFTIVSCTVKSAKYSTEDLVQHKIK